MERFAANGSAAQIDARDVYGIFSTLFRTGYYHARIGAVDDDRLQRIVGMLGAVWSDAVPLMTVARKDNPRYIAETEAMIPAHNECAYTPMPPRMLALYCVENDAHDGAFFALMPETLLGVIGEAYLPSLRGARFVCQMSSDAAPFETTLMRETGHLVFTSVASMTGASPYRLTHPVDEYSAHVLDRVTEVINDPQHRRRHYWQAGDLLIIDNWRLMHGREAFHGGNRVLRHIRLA